MAFASEQQQADARRHGRHRIMLAATFFSVHGEANGVLLDVSQGGAMLSASPPPPVGCRLLLERQNLEVPGIVRWVEGNRFGIQFEEPLSESVVMAIVSKGSQHNAN
ncbi:pilus assembly protein PilZ [Sphingomonas sp. Root710]|uniref:PilZ domain-containing protein n=1 Tax=Sphingomonas sp. Root710 TaxID=1736594 RepID=UPI0006F67C1D|nr:PilZ domain-containing protein [Sphingomonas sp. Root710]KRB85856.1 pilus assembly protein PilZ [Sphingomonas sp. Root710]